MKTLTLPQSSMLYGNGYQLWDGENAFEIDYPRGIGFNVH